MTVMPMLAKAGDLPTGPGWSYEPKYDGFRMMIDVPPAMGAAAAFIGRNKVEWDGAPYLLAEARRLLPRDTEVDGELISVNDWSQVATVVKRTQANPDQPHVPSAEIPALQFVVFDVTRWAGEDMTTKPFSERRKMLEMHAELAVAEDEDPILLAPSFRGEEPERFYTNLTADGWEGVMAKHDDGLYHTGRIDSKGNPKSQRAPLSEMVKVKLQDTVDVIVTAIYPPEKDSWLEAEGLPGRLGYAFRDGVEAGRVGTGFDRAARADIRDNAADWLGSVIEIGHMTVAADAEKLRHPAFIRRRDDKKPEDATRKEDA